MGTITRRLPVQNTCAVNQKGKDSAPKPGFGQEPRNAHLQTQDTDRPYIRDRCRHDPAVFYEALGYASEEGPLVSRTAENNRRCQDSWARFDYLHNLTLQIPQGTFSRHLKPFGPGHGKALATHQRRTPLLFLTPFDTTGFIAGGICPGAGRAVREAHHDLVYDERRALLNFPVPLSSPSHCLRPPSRNTQNGIL